MRAVCVMHYICVFKRVRCWRKLCVCYQCVLSVLAVRVICCYPCMWLVLFVLMACILCTCLPGLTIKQTEYVLRAPSGYGHQAARGTTKIFMT